MDDTLLSVGLDVGTTSTQMVVSRLTVHNRAGAFAVPEMEIRQRELLYQSPVYFTPLLEGNRMDAAALRRLVEQEYRSAGISREDVDTGAVIVTGESSRTENAAAVMEALADLAGNFVVAAAGPDLESVLAAKGAGAVDYSAKTGYTVLHMDIGGGTSNLALFSPEGLESAGCLNVGGRLVKAEDGRITYLSPVLEGLTDLTLGGEASEEALTPLAELLTRALCQAAGLEPRTGLLDRLITSKTVSLPRETPVLSFSGGVAAAMAAPETPALAYGDLGPVLARAILRSPLCRGPYEICPSPIRATVIGAGCHSATLSGSTVYLRGLRYPLQNLPVCPVDPAGDLEEAGAFDGDVVFALPHLGPLHFDRLQALARHLAGALGRRPAYFALEQDCAKALGQCLAGELPAGAPILCLDGLRLEAGTYLDVARPLAGGAAPVVIKTLVLPTPKEERM